MGTVMLAMLAALVVAALVALGEWAHGRRTARVARLAFGPLGRPARWAQAMPLVRVIAAGLATWGLLVLAIDEPQAVEQRPTRQASKHLLLCLDVSPSMLIKDAGPEVDLEGKKQSRAAWAGKLVQAVLDRLDMETTRITIVAFYTDALPVVQETFDKEVVRNALDGLPMYAAFEPGPTHVPKGLAKAFEIARPWPRKSATLLVVTDGDSDAGAALANMPSAIADAIVVGVGDPVRGSVVGGHNSRQDTMSLRQLAARLGGYFHEGNVKHLPSAVLAKLTMIAPRVGDRFSWRELALAAATIGCIALALAGPALLLFGRSKAISAARRAVARRPATDRLDASPRVAAEPARGG